MEEERGSDVVTQERPAPIWKIIVVASIAAGVQFGWALQLSLLTPYVQTLGVPHAYATFVWLCGPLSGLLVQPIVGYFSDNCTSPFGRRRPFIVGGGIFVAIAIFLIGFAKDLGHAAGDTLEQSTKPRAVAMFVVGFWILDVANNMLQGPTRAFLADLSCNNHRMMNVSNAYFSFFMAVGNVLGYAAGAYPSLYKAFPFTETAACSPTCANLKSCFLIDICILTVVVIVACCLVEEKQYTGDADLTKDKPVFFVQLALAFKQMKKPMWILLLVTCINWIAWFPFLLFDTDWMGREVFGGLPEGTGSALENSLYDRGVRAGAMGLLINSVVLAFTSLGIQPLSKLFGGAKNLWGAVNIVLAVGLGCTVWVSKVAGDMRDANGLQTPAPNVFGGALTIFALLGIPLSITFSLPFALASIYCSVAGGGQGLSLGVVNLSIVVPQMIVSVGAGPLDKLFGGGNLPAFVFGAVAAIFSSMLAIFVLPKPPRQSFTMVAGGGH